MIVSIKQTPNCEDLNKTVNYDFSYCECVERIIRYKLNSYLNRNTGLNKILLTLIVSVSFYIL